MMFHRHRCPFVMFIRSVVCTHICRFLFAHRSAQAARYGTHQMTNRSAQAARNARHNSPSATRRRSDRSFRAAFAVRLESFASRSLPGARENLVVPGNIPPLPLLCTHVLLVKVWATCDPQLWRPLVPTNYKLPPRVIHQKIDYNDQAPRCRDSPKSSLARFCACSRCSPT
jgi:hypothetical protein